jgi:hypothetical protein
VDARAPARARAPPAAQAVPVVRDDEDEWVQRAIHESLQQAQAAAAAEAEAKAEADQPGLDRDRNGERRWAYEELRRASAGGRAQLLGEGAFGPVYRGRLAGRMVAIQVTSAAPCLSLDREAGRSPRAPPRAPPVVAQPQMLPQATYLRASPARRLELEGMFRSEVEALGRYRHPNLVKLLGASHVADTTPHYYSLSLRAHLGPQPIDDNAWQEAAGEGKMALVYELMEGGSLRHCLVGGRGLTVHQRSGALAGCGRRVVSVLTASGWAVGVVCSG